MKKVLIVFLFLIAIQLKGQELPQIIPPSPEAVSIAKYIDAQVNMYTGSAKINIPIWTIKQGDLTLPISLSYSTGGIKVSEIASQVGLGWTLNAGGAISRSVRGGGPDDGNQCVTGFIEHELANYDPELTPLELKYIYGNGNCEPTGIGANNDVDGQQIATIFFKQNSYLNGSYDSQSDMYYYSSQGANGKFVFNNQGDIQPIPYVKTNITPVKNNNGEIIEWKIVDDNGVTYLYKDLENTKTIDSGGSCAISDHTSSWYPTTIISANQKDIIHFDYEQYQYDYRILKGETVYRPLSEGSPNKPSSIDQYISMEMTAQRLTKIRYGNNEVIFEKGTERCDMPGSFRLGKIHIFNGNRNIKSFNFDYSYMGNSSETCSFIEGNYDYENYRLMLASVTEVAGEETLPSYTFDYIGGFLPNRHSKAQDHWGYYNGSDGNTTLIPDKNFYTYNGQQFYDGANRSAKFSSAKIGALQTLYYPTGGHMTFDYEAHEVDAISNNRLTSNGTNATVVKSSMGYQRGSNIPQADEAGIFTIPRGGANVTIDAWNIPCTNFSSNSSNCNFIPRFQIFKNPGPDEEVVFTMDGVYPKVITNEGNTVNRVANEWYFSEGTYQIREVYGLYNTQYYHDLNPDAPTFEMLASWEQVFTSQNQEPAGGLRIAKKTIFDPVNNKTLIDTYDYTLGGFDEHTSDSSGRISAIPEYSYNFRALGVTGSSSRVAHDYLALNSTSMAPLTYSQGSAVGYSVVNKRMEDSNGNHIGYTRYFFTNHNLFADKFTNKIPDAHRDFSDNTYDFNMYLQPDACNNLSSPQLTYGFSESAGYINILGFRITSSHTLYNIVQKYMPKSEGYLGNNAFDYTRLQYPYVPIENNDYMRGLLRHQIDYDKNGVKVKEVENNYRIGDKFFSTDYGVKVISPIESNNPALFPIYYTNKYYYAELLSSSEKIYGSENPDEYVEKLTLYAYEGNHIYPTNTLTKESDNKSVITKTVYPDDLNTSLLLHNGTDIVGGELDNFSAINRLKSDDLHKIATPIQTEIYRDINSNGNADNNELLSVHRTGYKEWETDMVLPEYIHSAKGNTSLEERIIYHKYNSLGRPIEVSKADGSHIYYIWGYNGEYPIAKIENFKSSAITSVIQNLIDEAITSAANDNDRTIGEQGNEGLLRTALQEIRDAIPSAIITTYTYDPLIGITSITDPRGYTSYYNYDEFNRLKEIRDEKNNIVTDYKYNYKGK